MITNGSDDRRSAPGRVKRERLPRMRDRNSVQSGLPDGAAVEALIARLERPFFFRERDTMPTLKKEQTIEELRQKLAGA